MSRVCCIRQGVQNLKSVHLTSQNNDKKKNNKNKNKNKKSNHSSSCYHYGSRCVAGEFSFDISNTLSLYLDRCH